MLRLAPVNRKYSLNPPSSRTQPLESRALVAANTYSHALPGNWGPPERAKVITFIKKHINFPPDAWRGRRIAEHNEEIGSRSPASICWSDPEQLSSLVALERCRLIDPSATVVPDVVPVDLRPQHYPYDHRAVGLLAVREPPVSSGLYLGVFDLQGLRFMRLSWRCGWPCSQTSDWMHAASSGYTFCKQPSRRRATVPCR